MVDDFYNSDKVKSMVDDIIKKGSNEIKDVTINDILFEEISKDDKAKIIARGTFNNHKKYESDSVSQIPTFVSLEQSSSFLKTDDDKSNKKIIRENNLLLSKLPKYEVSKTQIYPLLSDEIRCRSVLNVNSLSKENGITNGLFDSRMGSVTHKEICVTCNRDDQDCGGHMGYFQLPNEIVNCIFRKEVIYALKSICPYCGDTYMDEYIYNALRMDKVPVKLRPKVIAEISEKWLWKLHNHGVARIIYDNDFIGSRLLFSIDIEGDKKKRIISVRTMKKIMNAVPENKWKYIGYTAFTKPLRYFTDVIPCAPPHIRPASIVNGKPMDHPLTTRYIELLKSLIRLAAPGNNKTEKDSEFENLYNIIKSIAYGPEKSIGVNIPLKESGIFPGLKTKKGFIRGNMMGKRVDHVGRTVAGPGFDCNVGEVSIPKSSAKKILLVPIMVNKYNIKKVTTAFKNRQYKYTTMKLISTKGMFPIEDKHINNYVPELGDIFLRPVKEGDRGLTGRQPSLQAESILGFNFIENKWDTVKIHQSNNSCFNADFDGDELTYHIIQDFMAMAEVDTVMNFKYHIMNVQSNRPMMALACHGLIGSFLMTKSWVIDGKKREVVIPEKRFNEALSLINDSFRKKSLNERLERHGINPLSGRALFSVCLPTNFTYTGSGVEIIDGILVKGILKDTNVGLKTLSLVQIISKMYSIKEAARFINDANKLADWFCMWHGLSIGYRDFNLNRKEVIKTLKKSLAKMQIDFFNLGPRPTDEIPLFFWMRSLHGIVDQTKINGKKIGEQFMKENNGNNILSKDGGCGAKGSLSNMSQATGSLGEQLIGSNIPKYELKGKTRCLPYFPSNDVSLHSIGYVFRSYMDSISPIDSMFHEMASRITLIDTARNVSEIGYTHRRVEKSLEPILITWLGIVGSNDGRMFQPIFGAGFDVSKTMPVTNVRNGECIFFCNFKDEAKLLNRIYERKNGIEHKTKIHKMTEHELFKKKNGRFPKFSEMCDI